MAKKIFNDANRPELAFLSRAEAITAPDESGEQIHYVFNTPAPESKTRRVQLLIRPTTYTQIKAIADRRGISANEIINKAIEKYIADNEE